MKSLIILFALAGALTCPLFCKAQSEPVEKPIFELMGEISQNMLKATKGLGNGFADVKGDYLHETQTGNVFYAIKNLQLHADTAFIVKKANGDFVLLASYKKKNDSDAMPITAYMSFSSALQSEAGPGFVTKRDTEPQEENTVKYYLLEKGVKIASFTFNTDTKQGIFVTPVQ